MKSKSYACLYNFGQIKVVIDEIAESDLKEGQDESI